MKQILPLLLILCVHLMGADKKKDKEDFERVKALAEKGSAKAQYSLGQKYYNGEGVEKDLKESVKWWRKAADQGDADAQYNLGVMYEKGHGVLEDYVTSYAWYNIATANGSALAKNNKATRAEKMTSEDISKAQALSKEMVKKNPKLMNK